MSRTKGPNILLSCHLGKGYLGTNLIWMQKVGFFNFLLTFFLFLLCFQASSMDESNYYDYDGSYIHNEMDELYFAERPRYPVDEEMLTEITRHYGPLVVQEGNFKEEATPVPWSSWWYPLWEKTLFEGGPSAPSTLERYDTLATLLTGHNPRSADYEREHVYDSRAVGWAGRCDAWALASILVPEPKKIVTKEGISFRIRDLKGLILKTFERVEGLKHFGQRYNGQWDSIYEDIYADQFHRFIQAEIFEKKRSFIMDHDPGMEVWNTPVWKVQTKISADEQNENLFHVKTWIYSVDPHIRDLDFVGSAPVVRSYTYDLYGERQSDGSLAVSYGLWTESSRWDHPDYLIPFPERPQQLIRKSYNEKLNFAIIDSLIKASI